MPAAKVRAKSSSKPVKKAPETARMSLAEVMRTLEKAGTAQTKKTYMRHGAKEPLFGVLFATHFQLMKRIGVDQDLALALWGTGNWDARNLAMKVADPARMTSAELDRWARDTDVRMVCGYVACLAAESPHASAKASQWLASGEERLRCAGWGVVGQMAARDEATPDRWFGERLEQIARTIHEAPNGERGAMNGALITIGGRSPALRTAALAAAKKIGKVEVDHGDTACKTPDAAPYVEKMWARSKAGGFASPAAQERSRESQRTRC